jgi:hypothetical protein
VHTFSIFHFSSANRFAFGRFHAICVVFPDAFTCVWVVLAPHQPEASMGKQRRHFQLVAADQVRFGSDCHGFDERFSSRLLLQRYAKGNYPQFSVWRFHETAKSLVNDTAAPPSWVLTA